MAKQLEFQDPANPEKGWQLQLPASWNELTGRQLLACTRILFGTANPQLQHLQLLRVIMPVPTRVFRLLEPWQLLELKTLTEFFRQPKLTRQLLPDFIIGFRRYHGPKDSFRDLQLLEFVFADTYFLKWHQEQSGELLDKLIAVLYRPAKSFLIIRKRQTSYDGDPRQVFNPHFVPARAKRIRKLPAEKKLAILTWYRGCRAWLEKKYPNVFSVENQGQAKKQGSWEPVLRNMAGGKFGDIYKTGEANLLTILQEMDDAIAAAEEMEEKYNSK